MCVQWCMAMSTHQTCQWDSLSNNIFNHWFKLMIQNKLWRLDYRNERAQSLYILCVRGLPFAKHVWQSDEVEPRVSKQWAKIQFPLCMFLHNNHSRWNFFTLYFASIRNPGWIFRFAILASLFSILGSQFCNFEFNLPNKLPN